MQSPPSSTRPQVWAAIPLYLATRGGGLSAGLAVALTVLAAVVAPDTPVLLFDDVEVRTAALFGLLAAGAVLPGLRASLGEAEEISAGMRSLRAVHAGLASLMVAACCLPFAVRGGADAGGIAVTNALFFLGVMLATAALRSPVPDWALPTTFAGLTYLLGTLEGDLAWWAFLLRPADDAPRLALTSLTWALGAALFVGLRRRQTVDA
ncbi:MAG: hypothetical protein ACT4PP_17050 [Sporichthyaceae bacterium]